MCFDELQVAEIVQRLVRRVSTLNGAEMFSSVSSSEEY